MKNDDEQLSHCRRFPFGISFISFFAVVLYVLGSGPALKLSFTTKSPGARKGLSMIYKPLHLAAQKSPLVGKVLHPYFNYWRPAFLVS